MGLLASGSFLLAVGIGLLVWDHNPDAVKDIWLWIARPAEPASSPIPAVETRMIGTDSPAEPEHGLTPAWAAPAFVWGVWALMLLAGLAFIGKYAHNVPYSDDWWHFIPFVTGESPVTVSFLWSQECEHRYPLPKALGIILLKVSGGDFRAPMYFRTLALGGLAFALIRVARSLRGWTSYTDAFLALALLQWGFPTFRTYAWVNVIYFVPTIIAGLLLSIAVQRGTRLTLGTGMLAGLCLALLSLCGAAGLIYMPLITLWLGYSALLSWRSPEPHGKRTSLAILGWISTALLIGFLYFRGHEKSTAYAPASPSVWITCKTSLAVLAGSLGEETSKWTFPFSGLAPFVLVVLSTGILIFAARRDKQGLNRGRALGLLCSMVASGMLVLGLGWGRAGLGYEHGFGYGSLSVPILCCIYLAWGLCKSRKIGHFAQACLLTCLCFVIWDSIPPASESERKPRCL